MPEEDNRVTTAAGNVATRYAARLAALAAAKVEEKTARRLRREGRDQEAVESYGRARDLYRDSDFAHDSQAEEELVDEVLRAIKRCDVIVDNIKHPKTQRPAATSPRPNCLSCTKPLPRFRFDGKTYDDGTPREWGAYGDNRFCSLTCGWHWACAHAPMPKGKKDGAR